MTKKVKIKEGEVEFASKEEALFIDFKRKIDSAIEGLKKELAVNEFIAEKLDEKIKELGK